jgi:hypothetical protein
MARKQGALPHWLWLGSRGVLHCCLVTVRMTNCFLQQPQSWAIYTGLKVTPAVFWCVGGCDQLLKAKILPVQLCHWSRSCAWGVSQNPVHQVMECLSEGWGPQTRQEGWSLRLSTAEVPQGAGAQS